MDNQSEIERLMSQLECEGTYKRKNNPRVTKFGKLLQKTNLDGLPQFYNMLNKKMIDKQKATIYSKKRVTCI